MRKSLFTLFALILTISAVLGLSLTVNAVDYELNVEAVLKVGNNAAVTYDSFSQAIAAGEAQFVEGKIDVNDIGVVAIVKDGDYTVNTNTIVAVAVKDGVSAPAVASGVVAVTTKTMTIDGTNYTAKVYVNTANVKAAIGKTFYKNVQAAVTAATVTTIEDAKNNPVVVFGNGNYTSLTTTGIATLVPYTNARFNLGNGYLNYEVTGISYENNSYTANVIINTETFAQAITVDGSNNVVFYSTVAGAVDAAKTNDIKKVTDKVVVVLKKGDVSVSVPEQYLVAVAPYNNQTTLTFGDVFKYSETVAVDTDFLGGYITVTAAVNAEAVLVETVGNNKTFTLCSSIATAIGAAKTNDIKAATNKVVVALKNVTVNPAWFGGANLVAIVGANGATVNSNGLFTYTKEDVDSGVDFVGTVDAHVVVNAEAIVVDRTNGNAVTLYNTVAEAVAAAKTNDIKKATNKAVVVLKKGNVSVTVPAGELVAVAPYNGETTLNFGNAFTYSKDVTVDTEVLSGTITVYAVVNAEAIVVDRTNGNAVTLYNTVAEAVAAAKTNDIKKATNKAVVVLKKGNVSVTVPAGELVAVAPYNGETTLNFGNAFTYSKDVAVDTELLSGTITVYAVVNAEAIVVDRTNGNAITLYNTVAEAVNAASTANIEKITDKVVIVLEKGDVSVTVPAGKMVALTAYDNTTDIQFTDGVFTYSQEVAVETDFVSGTFTVYAAIGAEAIVIDMNKDDLTNINTSNIVDIITNNIKFFASVNEAIAAADGKLTSAVVVLKKGAISPVVNDFVFLAAIDESTTFNKAGYFTFDVELEYEGFAITAIAVYNTEYIFGGTADAITAAFPAVNATYTGTEFNIAITSANIFELTSAEYYADILIHFAPLFILGDEAYVNENQVYAGRQLQVSELVKAIKSCIPTLADLENIDKNILSVDVKIGSAGTYETFALNFILEMSDEKFEKIRDAAAAVNKYFELDIVDGKVIFAIDARPIVDIIFEKELTKGKTIKEVRDYINALSINSIADLVEGYGLTGKKAKAAELFVKAVDKVRESNYASYLDIAIGMLDLEQTGEYKVEMSFTIDLGTKIESAINKFNTKFPTIAKYVTFDQFANVDSITVAFDGTIAVFDVYTVTFVDADGNVIYTESLLEGETPVFTGDAPIKEPDGEFTYEFAGWTDGEVEYEGELAPLTKDTTYEPFFNETPIVEEAEIKFAGATVSFENSFKLNLYIEESELEGYEGFWVEVRGADANGNAVEENIESFKLVSGANIKGADPSKNYYRFSYSGIAAKNIGDGLNYQIIAWYTSDIGTVTNVEGEKKLYSIRDYAVYHLGNDNNTDEFKTLLVDALVYAAKAQLQFDYNTGSLVTAGLEEYLSLGTSGNPGLTKDMVLNQTGDEAVTFLGASLVYESNVHFKIYVDLKDLTPDDIYVIIRSHDGNTETRIDNLEEELIVESGDFYAFRFDKYAAKELGNDIVVTIYDAYTDEALSSELTYSVEAYGIGLKNNGENIDVVYALLNYANSAKVYFDSISK